MELSRSLQLVVPSTSAEVPPWNSIATGCQPYSMRNVLPWFHGGTFIGDLRGLC
jgi:hypothetical protein